MALQILSMKIGFGIVGCLLIGLCFIRGFMRYVGKALDWAIDFCRRQNGDEPLEQPETRLNPVVTVFQIVVCLIMGYWFGHRINFTVKSSLEFLTVIAATWCFALGLFGYVDNLETIIILKLLKMGWLKGRS